MRIRAIHFWRPSPTHTKTVLRGTCSLLRTWMFEQRWVLSQKNWKNRFIVLGHWTIDHSVKWQNMYLLFQKPRLGPSPAGAKPWVVALAWPISPESQSRLKPSQSHSFWAKLGQNITSSLPGPFSWAVWPIEVNWSWPWRQRQGLRDGDGSTSIICKSVNSY